VAAGEGRAGVVAAGGGGRACVGCWFEGVGFGIEGAGVGAGVALGFEGAGAGAALVFGIEGAATFVGWGDVALNVPVARTWSSILLVAGVAGVGCFAVTTGFAAAVSFAATFCVSVGLGIVLLGGVTGAACRVAVTGFGASFFVTVFVRAGAGAFFSLTTFSFTAAGLLVLAALFVLACLTPATLPSSEIVPASSATFFGRPRFLVAVGSVVLAADIAGSQLMRML
jgi:hypothetical protein